MSEALFEIQGLHFAYKQQVIFDQAHLVLNHPGVYGLVGPNGSGKSTLFNLIAGLLPFQQGIIAWKGEPVAAHLAYMQDSHVLYPYLTGRDHIQFVARQHQVDAKRVQTLSDRLDIQSFVDKPIRTFSMGQRQRLMIVLALMPQASVLLMDEPLNGLDPDSVLIIRTLLQQLNDQDQVVVVSSHNLDELQKVTQKIIFKVDAHLELTENLTDPEAYYAHRYHASVGGAHV